MRWLFRAFASAVVRRVAYITVAVLAALVAQAMTSVAHAAVDQGQAMVACESFSKGYWPSAGGKFIRCENSSTPKQIWSVGEDQWGRQTYYGGWQWQDSCSTRVDGQAGMINGTLYSGGVCDNGCKVQPNLDRGTDFSLRENGNPNAISIRSGTWRATGDVCSITDTRPKPDKKDEYCHQTGNYTVCKSKDKTCITTASGFRTCASDTANEKGHTATNNPRTEAASISAPNTPPNPPTNRPGEDWKPSGPSTSVTNNNTGSTTNTQNFNNQGTPNGNQPTPGDGSGPGAGGSNGNGDGGGKEEGPPDSASDSGNCASPPQCTGDTLKCLQLNYTWRVQCNTKGAEITGGDGCTDKDIPVCAGTTCKAEAYAQLLQQWRQGCAAKAAAEGMASRAGNISNPDDESALEGLWIKPGDSEGGGMKLRQDLISVGGGGSLLPNISLEGQSWQPPPEFFDSLAAIRLLVIAAATVTAMVIVGRNI